MEWTRKSLLIHGIELFTGVIFVYLADSGNSLSVFFRLFARMYGTLFLCIEKEQIEPHYYRVWHAATQGVAWEKGRIKGKRLRRACGTLDPPIFLCFGVDKAA